MKAKNVIIGILIIIFGVLGILEASGVHLIDSRVTYLQVVGGLILGILFISELFKKQFYSAIFLLAFLFMLFERNIAYIFDRSELINNWLLLLFVVIICIGINVIVPDSYSKKIRISGSLGNDGDYESNNFGGHMTYVDCSDFTEKHIINRFGETEIHFENTEEYLGTAVLTIDNMFGETRIFVPSDWSVSLDVKNIFGDSSNSIPKTHSGSKLIIQGQNKFGEIDVIGV